MTAATAGRNTPARNADQISGLVNSGATIYAGTLVTRLTSGGNLVPAGTASAGAAVGVAEDTVIGDGVKTLTYSRGCYAFFNSSDADEIAVSDIGATCYIVDNQTVAKTDGSASRKAAGKIIDVDARGVWVLVG
ncbi:hypothetical protein [Thermomonas sp.]|uniref:hypothetical protein n=1 Tax=Thermomonas sp. TaxID=1971895 RepID=UPI002621DBBB|nr:hypothetical protein [Thermomonas sp.]